MLALVLSLALAAPAPPAVAPRCERSRELVVLWHKDMPSVARATVTHALADACFKVAEQFNGTRREATELADLLRLPLLNVKALRQTAEDGTQSLVVGLDVIDTGSEELKVLVSAAERAPAPTSDDARAWHAQRPLIARAIARVRHALAP